MLRSSEASDGLGYGRRERVTERGASKSVLKMLASDMRTLSELLGQVDEVWETEGYHDLGQQSK